mgnify:FL=1
MNIIVTCARHFETETIEEIRNLLSEVGDENPEVIISEFSGILYVNTLVDPIKLVKKIREKLEDEPWLIRYTLRVIPIFSLTKTDLLEITESAIKQSQKISENQTYRITVEKRNSGISSSEIIKQIADKIPFKVSLEKYDWNILIQILGSVTGISIIKESDILRIQSEKRQSLE